MVIDSESGAASQRPQQRSELAASAAYLLAAFSLGSLATWAVMAPREVTQPAQVRPELSSPAPRNFRSRSMSLINEKRYADAIQICERGLAAYPGDIDLRNNLGVAHLLSDGIGRGESIFAELVAEVPEFERAKNNLGWAKSLRAGVESEIAEAQKLVASANTPAGKTEALWAVAGAYIKLGQDREAIAAYEAILALEPENAAAYNNIGVRLMEMGEYAAARSRFEQASRLEPGAALYRNNIGWARSSLEKKS
ncbi:MAG: tetratricopeptide repeat protein [Panacagrimonas sp.]